MPASSQQRAYWSLGVVSVLVVVVAVYAQMLARGVTTTTMQRGWVVWLAALLVTMVLAVVTSLAGQRLVNRPTAAMLAAVAGAMVGAAFSIQPLGFAVVGLIVGLGVVFDQSKRVALGLGRGTLWLARLLGVTLAVVGVGAVGGCLARWLWIRGGESYTPFVGALVTFFLLLQVLLLVLAFRRRANQPRQSVTRLALVVCLGFLAGLMLIPLGWPLGWHLETARRVWQLRSRGGEIEFAWDQSSWLRLMTKGPLVMHAKIARSSVDDWATLRALEPLQSLMLVGESHTDNSLVEHGPTASAMYVAIGETKIHGRDLHKLPLLKRAAYLSVDSTPLTDEGLRAACRNGSLSGIHLRDTDITGKGLSALRMAPAITSVSVASKTIGDDGMREIGKLALLQYLGLDCPKTTPQGIAPLANLTQLIHLRISSPVEVEHVEQLRKLPQGTTRNMGIRVDDTSAEMISALIQLNKTVSSLTVYTSSIENKRLLEKQIPGISVEYVRNP